MNARTISTFLASALLATAALAPAVASARYRAVSGMGARQQNIFGWLHYYADYTVTSEFNDAKTSYFEVDVTAPSSPATAQACAQTCRDNYWGSASFCSGWTCAGSVTSRVSITPSFTEWKNGTFADYRWVDFATTDTTASTRPIGYYLANTDP